METVEGINYNRKTSEQKKQVTMTLKDCKKLFRKFTSKKQMNEKEE